MKKDYVNISIPNELEQRVDNAIQKGLTSRPKMGYRKKVSIGMIIIFCAFITLLNTVPAFAKTIYEIEGIGVLGRFFTFREYKYADTVQYINVKMPEFHYTKDATLENRVNLEISKFVHEQYNNAQENAKEYYDAFIATGGKEEDFHPIEVNIDYHIYYTSDKIVSFVLTKTESFSSAYTSYYYYNLDLETGRNFSIKELLGTNYKSIIEKSIQKEIATWSKEKKSMLFDPESIQNYVQENQSFYINDKNQIVIVFEKYQIGVGTLGQVEFIVET